MQQLNAVAAACSTFYLFEKKLFIFDDLTLTFENEIRNWLLLLHIFILLAK